MVGYLVSKGPYMTLLPQCHAGLGMAACYWRPQEGGGWGDLALQSVHTIPQLIQTNTVLKA